MLTGEIRNRIDQIWNAFWPGGISNPLEVIEQITYLLFLRRLDDLETLEESKSTRLGPWPLSAGIRCGAHRTRRPAIGFLTRCPSRPWSALGHTSNRLVWSPPSLMAAGVLSGCPYADDQQPKTSVPL